MSGEPLPLDVDSSSAEEAGEGHGSEAFPSSASAEPFLWEEKCDRGSAWDRLWARCRAALFRALTGYF